MTDEAENSKSSQSTFERAFFRITFIQTFLAFVGIATGCIALYAALNEADAVRKQQQASVLPLVQIGFSNLDPVTNEKTFVFSVKNSGIGPAVVKDFSLLVDGESSANWIDLFSKLGVEETNVNNMATSYLQNRIITAGETIEAVAVKGEDSEQFFTALNNNYSRISIGMCFCSVFDDCWKVDSQKPETLSSPETTGTCNR